MYWKLDTNKWLWINTYTFVAYNYILIALVNKTPLIWCANEIHKPVDKINSQLVVSKTNQDKQNNQSMVF